MSGEGSSKDGSRWVIIIQRANMPPLDVLPLLHRPMCVQLLTMSIPVVPSAPRAGQRSGRSPPNIPGPGVGPAGVSDAAGPAGSGAAGAAGAEDAAREGEAAGSERAAGLGPRRRTLPAPPQTGRETGE